MIALLLNLLYKEQRLKHVFITDSSYNFTLKCWKLVEIGSSSNTKRSSSKTSPKVTDLLCIPWLRSFTSQSPSDWLAFPLFAATACNGADQSQLQPGRSLTLLKTLCCAVFLSVEEMQQRRHHRFLMSWEESRELRIEQTWHAPSLQKKTTLTYIYIYIHIDIYRNITSILHLEMCFMAKCISKINAKRNEANISTVL